jgi:FKBP-type peptidyl-prolyl cis-trans isomerase (trigger factor)
VRGSPIREKLPEQIELLFDLLKKAEKAGVDKEELQSRYKQITSNYIQNVGLSLKNQEELDAIKEALRHHNI